MNYKPLPGQLVRVYDRQHIVCEIADYEDAKRKHTIPMSMYMEDCENLVPVQWNGRHQGWFNYCFMDAVTHPIECECGNRFLIKDDYVCGECRAREI